MKQKYTKQRKARRGPNITAKWPYGANLFMRRIMGIYGADHRETDKRFPSLESAVQGYRDRVNNKRAE